LSQDTPATPGQDEKLPFHIPVKISLMNQSAELMPLQLNFDQQLTQKHMVLNFTDTKQKFEFKNIEEKPLLSILKGYSAPVKVHFERDDEELAFCMAHEADDFNRWEAGQQLSARLILSLIEMINSGRQLILPDYYINACQKTLNDKVLDKALIRSEERRVGKEGKNEFSRDSDKNQQQV